MPGILNDKLRLSYNIGVNADSPTALLPSASGSGSEGGPGVNANHKGMLNEKLQKEFNGAIPMYTVSSQDPASGHFKASVKICLPGKDDLEVEGDPAPQKKAAEHSAAMKALERLVGIFPQGLANAPGQGGEDML